MKKAKNSSLGKLILRDFHWLIISKNNLAVPMTWSVNAPIVLQRNGPDKPS
jgi:hypothetical protein